MWSSKARAHKSLSLVVNPITNSNRTKSSLYEFQGFSSINKVEPCKDQCRCTHPYLNKWDGIYPCMDCWCKLNDTPEAIEKNKDRLALEAELEKNTPVDVIGVGQSVGSMSAARGVKIGWLLAFTKYYDCYEWNSWDIIRKILKPATEERRCRVVELPEMARFVGPAKTFISYAQAGKWVKVYINSDSYDSHRLFVGGLFQDRYYSNIDKIRLD